MLEKLVVPLVGGRPSLSPSSSSNESGAKVQAGAVVVELREVVEFTAGGMPSLSPSSSFNKSGAKVQAGAAVVELPHVVVAVPVRRQPDIVTWDMVVQAAVALVAVPLMETKLVQETTGFVIVV